MTASAVSYREVLEEIRRTMAADGFRMQPPATDAEVSALEKEAEAQLGASVPAEYRAFLRTCNGLDWNGLLIYAASKVPIAGRADRFITGFLEANLAWRESEPHRQYLFFGDSGISRYVLDLKQSRYAILDRQSDTLIEMVPSFEELMARALRAHAG
jgi:hypothetical protein